MEANYLGLHENLMDLTHFPFLHGKWNIASPEHAMAPVNIDEDGDVIRQWEVHEDVEFPPPLAEAAGMKAPFIREAHHLVQTPGMHQGKQVTYGKDNPEGKDIQHVIHIMTPESEGVTHYLWAIARHNAIDDKELDAAMQEVGAGAFMEDKIALEEIEDIYRRDHRPGFREKIIKSDEGGIRVLRMIARWAKEEQEESVAELEAAE